MIETYVETLNEVIAFCLEGNDFRTFSYGEFYLPLIIDIAVSTLLQNRIFQFNLSYVLPREHLLLNNHLNVYFEELSVFIIMSTLVVLNK